MNAEEERRGCRTVIYPMDDGDGDDTTTQQHPTTCVADQKTFDFHAVYGPNSTQQQVYADAVGDAGRQVLDEGYNTTILAYGMTGSGKVRC